MADRIIHLADVGVVLVVTFVDEDGDVIDVSDQTTMEIFVKKPDGETATLTAAFTDAGADGKIQFVTIAGTLDQAGLWEYQGHVITSALNIVTVKKSIVVQNRIVE